MKHLPIPVSAPATAAADLAAQVRDLRAQMEVVRRNQQAFLARGIEAGQIHRDAVDVRHFAASIYGLVGDLASLALGAVASAGTSELVARADHKHALDPLLVLRRADPAQLTGNTNDWAIGTSNSLYYFDANGAVNVTGIAGGAADRLLILVNDGANAVTFTDQDVLSAAANRIITGTGAGVVVAADQNIKLVYDAAVSRWRGLL